MADPQQQANLNTLLKWGIENSGDGSNTVAASDASAPRTRLDPGVLDAVFGGPSDAELMKASMESIRDPNVSLDDKLTAFDNFEQLVEGIDNANNLGALDLWSPLVQLLDDPELKLRWMAAWCIGTAVQNNPKAQETAVTVGALPRLAKLALGQRPDAEAGDHSEGQISEDERSVRRKACYAISSAIRNYQPGAKVVVESLPKDMASRYKDLDASDMEAVDKFMEELRSHSAK